MTSTLTLTIPAGNVGDLSKLFELERAGVIPPDQVVYYPDPPRYEVTADGPEATYLLDQLQIASESVGGESFPEWFASRSQQIDLPLSEAEQRADMSDVVQAWAVWNNVRNMG